MNLNLNNEPDDSTPEHPSETPQEPTTPENKPESEEKIAPLEFGLSDEELQKELHKYAKSLREEFARAESPDDRAAENVEKFTRDFFKKNLAHAAAQVVWLSTNSTSDSIRLRACQIIIKEALEDARADGDPIRDLLSDLMKPAVEPALATQDAQAKWMHEQTQGDGDD